MIAPPSAIYITARQTEIWLLIARGLTQKEAADKLGISIKTVGATLTDVYEKLGVRSAQGALVEAIRYNLVSVEPPSRVLIIGNKPAREPHLISPKAVRRPVA